MCGSSNLPTDLRMWIVFYNDKHASWYIAEHAWSLSNLTPNVSFTICCQELLLLTVSLNAYFRLYTQAMLQMSGSMSIIKAVIAYVLGWLRFHCRLQSLQRVRKCHGQKHPHATGSNTILCRSAFVWVRARWLWGIWSVCQGTESSSHVSILFEAALIHHSLCVVPRLHICSSILTSRARLSWLLPIVR